ncbi:MAG: DUF3306 domain-containing protein [Xanthobacteraceae bacterium]
MSDDENFLARWSSRKLANRTEPAPADTHPEPPPRDESVATDNAAVAETPNDRGTPDTQPPDPAPLPSLDSIGPDSSVAAFLRADVPPELTRAALRRAWTADPAIKNFVGLVENGWDFNDPSAMPGFGAISPEEVARLAGQVIAALPQAEVEDRPSTTEKKSTAARAGVRSASHEAAPETAEAAADADHDAAQQNEADKSS